MRLRAAHVIKPARVVIVEGCTLFRELLALVVAERLGHTVTAACATVADGVETVRLTKPDLVITERTLSDGRGVDLVRLIRRESPSTRCLLLPATAEAHFVCEASALGQAKGAKQKGSCQESGQNYSAYWPRNCAGPEGDLAGILA